MSEFGSIVSGAVRRSMEALERVCAPTGKIAMFAAATPPNGWFLCDGSVRPRTDRLFTVIGTTYGAGNGTTTYNLPNLKGRMPVGHNPSDASFDVVGETGGSKDATLPTHTHTITHTHEHSHTHTINHDHAQFNTGSSSVSASNLWVNNASGGGDIPGGASPNAQAQGSAHTHTVNVPSFSGTSGGASDATTGGSSAANTGSAGSSGTNANLPPYISVPFIIKG